MENERHDLVIFDILQKFSYMLYHHLGSSRGNSECSPSFCHKSLEIIENHKTVTSVYPQMEKNVHDLATENSFFLVDNQEVGARSATIFLI